MSFLIPSYLSRVFASPSCPFTQIFIYWYPLNILSLAVNSFLGSVCSCSTSSNHLSFLKSSPKLIILLNTCTGLLMEINSLKLITVEFTVREECLSNHWLGEESRNHTSMHILALTNVVYHQQNHSSFLDSVTTWCKCEYSHTSLLALKFWLKKLNKYAITLSTKVLPSLCGHVPSRPSCPTKWHRCGS